MGWVWSTLGFLGTVAGLLALSLGIFVYFVAPERRLNRYLGVFLAMVGIGTGLGSGVMYMVEEYGIAYASQLVTYHAMALGTAVYALFIGMALLNTPLTAPLRWRGTQWILALSVVVIEVLIVAQPELFSRGLHPTVYGTWENSGGPLARSIFRVGGFLTLFGFFASLHNWYRTTAGTLQRRRAKLYTLAFGLFDIPFTMYSFVWRYLPPAQKEWVGYALFVPLMCFPLVLAYAIVKGQLFDVDLKIKIGVRRGTLAGIYVAVLVIVSQVAQNFIGEALGWATGGIVTAILLLAMTPLQKFAHKVADTAMPDVNDTQQYRTFRKLEVYKDALEAFSVDGTLSARETAALSRLQTKLGLAEKLVRQLRRDYGPASSVGAATVA